MGGDPRSGAAAGYAGCDLEQTERSANGTEPRQAPSFHPLSYPKNHKVFTHLAVAIDP
jgi:hypothetical protein